MPARCSPLRPPLPWGPMAIRLLAASLLSLAFHCLGSAAYAQERSEDPRIEEARALFVAGNAAVESGRWADAAANFERSYELSKVPSALYNAAVALRTLGKYRKARDAFALLLAEHGSSLNKGTKRKVDEALEEIRARIATLHILGLAAEPHRITLDTELVPDPGDRPLSIDADPGVHTLLVEREAYRLFRWNGELKEGEALSVRTVWVPLQEKLDLGAQNKASHAPVDDEHSDTILESPWFWIATAAIVVISAGVVAYFVLGQEEQLQPESSLRIEL